MRKLTGSDGGGPEEARQRLVEAAEQCFLDFGMKRTTMEDVARRAGVSRPTVYSYFSDRDALIIDVVSRRTRAHNGKMRAYIDARPTFAEKVVDGVAFSVASGRGDPIMQALLRPDNLDAASGVLGRAHTAQDLTFEVWAPILEKAQQAGDMRADLDVRNVCEWIADIELMMVGRTDLFSSAVPGPKELVAEFLLPALVPEP